MVAGISGLFQALEALRENPARARSIGYDIGWHRLAAFVISAIFSGLAGGFYALLREIVNTCTSLRDLVPGAVFMLATSPSGRGAWHRPGGA